MLPIAARFAARPRRRTIAVLSSVVVTLGSSALLPTVAPGQSTSNVVILSGQVVDRQTGEPVKGTLVEVAPARKSAVTDAEGRFAVRLRAGDYVVSASQLGYAEHQELVSVRPGAADPLLLRIEPRPMLLEGIKVVADRFESRRHMVPMASQVWDRSRLSRAGGQNLGNALRFSGTLTPMQCTRGAVSMTRYASASESFGGEQGCVYSRGQVVVPAVYIDDRIAFGGMFELNLYVPSEMHHVEVYGRGRMIRAYTVGYVEAVASGNRRMVAMNW